MRGESTRGESTADGSSGCAGAIVDGPNLGQAIAALAAGQRGVASRAQLLELGMSPGAIQNRIRAGGLHRLHHGVYSLGHRHLAPGAPEMAAVLACGSGAVLSHGSAARLYELLGGAIEPGPSEVSIAANHSPRRAGVRARRVHAFGPGEVGTLDGIPITSPARTILDLAATEPKELERIVAEAHAKRLVTAGDLRRLITRHRGRSGTRILRELLEQPGGPRRTRSAAERRFLALIRSAPADPGGERADRTLGGRRTLARPRPRGRGGRLRLSLLAPGRSSEIAPRRQRCDEWACS